MVDHVNRHRSKQIVTIEDPIEFLHRDIKSIVIQREVGSDTEGFEPALRAALRQDPDIILIGEMRDRTTIEIAKLINEGGAIYGMQGFDQHLMDLHRRRLISRDVAMVAATSPADFERNLQFH
jgi:Tfp pilus assembly pilus retraction ATPase PilT